MVNRTFNTYGGQSYSFDDIINEFNNSNLTAVIDLKCLLRNDFVFNELAGGVPVTLPFDGLDNYGYASVFDANNNPIDVQSIVVNASTFKQYAPGAYHKVGTDDLEIYMQGSQYQNKIEIPAIHGFPGIKTAFNLPPKVEITNLNRGDTVHTSANFNLAWIGGGVSSKCEIAIRYSDELSLPTDTVLNSGVSMIIDNSGFYNYSSVTLQKALQYEGYYDVSVKTFDPVYLTLTNGKEILIVAENIHRKTIYFKP